jgi:uncharacterized damage-inducible protein DinB
MSIQTHFTRGFAHSRWADGQLLPYLPEAPERAKRIWAHMLSTPVVWVSRLARPEIAPPVWPNLEGFDFAVAVEKAYESIHHILDQYGPYYEHRFDYRTSKGEAFGVVVSEMLEHIMLHSHYHRGQINLLLRDAGIQPPSIDYIVFSRTVSPLV